MIKVITNRVAHFQNFGWQDFDSIENSIMYLESLEWVAYDSETTGMSFFDHDFICIQLGDSKHQYVIDLETVEINHYKKLLVSKPLIIQRGVFDLPFLYKYEIIPNKLYDTHLAEFNLSLGIKTHRRDLGSLTKRYCGIEIDKSHQGKIYKTGLDSIQAVEYSGTDIAYLHEIKEKQEILLDKWGVRRAVDLDSEFTKVLAYLEYCGTYLNTDKWFRVCRRLEYEEYGAWLKLNEYLEEHTDISPLEFNWDSPPQVVKLFKKLRINVVDKKTRKETVQEGHLLKQKHELIPMYLNYKHKAKAVSTYGRTWLDFPRSDKRIHSKFNPLVNTGRTSCGNVSKGPFPNLQNISSSEDMRHSFEGQGPNRLIICDYSGQESVIMADRSKEPSLLKFYQEGHGDLHSYVASLIWGEPYEDICAAKDKKRSERTKRDLVLLKQRQQAKAANFAISFGGTGYTIANNLNIPPEEGERVFNAYMKAFPKLKNYFDRVYKTALSKGYILINEVTGRKRFIENYRSYLIRRRKGAKSKRFESAIYRASLNTPIQGTAADMSKTAGIYIFKWIVESGNFGRIKMTNFVHDEWVLECHQRRVEGVAPIIQECMERAAEDYLETLKITAEPETSKVWIK